MQSGKALETGNTSSWYEKCLDVSGCFPVPPVALPRRHVRYALLCRPESVCAREFISVVSLLFLLNQGILVIKV